MNMPDEIQLGRTPPFCRLGPQQLRAILDLATAESLSVGAVVFDEGQPARRFHFLLSGHIRLLRMTADGDQIILLHIPGGQMFGIGAALGQHSHQTTAVAAGTCVVLSWPNALWPVFSVQYDGFAAETFRAFGARTIEMSNRIVEMSTKLVEQRIACALLRMLAQSGRKVPGGIAIGFPITRQNIADLTGTTLHTVSRLVSRWEKQGMVESARCSIVVKDPHRMMLVSGGEARIAPDALTLRAKGPPHGDSVVVKAVCRSQRNPAASSPYSRQASVTV